MKTIIIFINFLLLFLLSGCLYPDETGVSKWHYNKCQEYYDVAGKYHKECDYLFEYKDLNPFRKEPAPSPFGTNNCQTGDCSNF